MRTVSRMAALVLMVMLTASSVAAGQASDLVDPYLRIHAALAGDRLDGVAEEAARMEAEARALGDPGRAMADAASALAAAGDLNAARTAFGRLSDALLAWADASDTDLGSGVTTMYCPMADKSWVQKGEGVKNPYYGSAMLTCGAKKSPSS